MSEAALEAHTPLMKQYWDLKAQQPDALLLFRMGDFYELFGEDAVVAARILEIVLTSRDKNKENPIPMAGVPHHSVQSYIQKLLKAGKKVAIGEQMENPATKVFRTKNSLLNKSIVRREIVRVFTPAIQFDEEGSKTSYLATALPIDTQKNLSQNHWILACLDVATGETRLSTPLSFPELLLELDSLPIAHFLFRGDRILDDFKSTLGNTLTETLPLNYLTQTQAQESLQRHYALQNLEILFSFLSCSSSEDPVLQTATRALAILLTYATRSQKLETLLHLRSPSPLHESTAMQLGPKTPQHLDLLPSPEGIPNLYDLINLTRSALGARELKRWILAPLIQPEQIQKRQKAVRELTSLPRLTSKISEELSALYDLERICGRINAQLANPRDTLALGKSLAILTRLVSLLEPLQTEIFVRLRDELQKSSEILAPLADRILKTQTEDAPLTFKEGGIFKAGTSPELDHLLSLTENGQRFLIDLEARERAATQIPSLKVRYNRVFGYYIEVTHAHSKNVPAHYQRKQTMVGAERFFTEELKKFEEEILTASSRQKALEQALFEDLLRALQENTSAIMNVAAYLSRLDVLHVFSKLAVEPGWCFPEIDNSLDLKIEKGRHPIVDASCRGSFVPNDLYLSENLSENTNSEKSRRLLLITGPNMGGKSTVMRQVALIAILGQTGAPVPAQSAQWGVFSSLYTRIGAQDAIARGQSTFMVEMSELAQILRHADARALLILDEIGRGTSTYDGISVAWATLEWISKEIKARTLFATHYHELTHLEGKLSGVANAHMAVEGARVGGNLRFLYQLRAGPTADSFGIHVAKLAGIPAAVVERAWEVLEELERGGGLSPHDVSNETQNEPVNFRHQDMSRITQDEPTPGLRNKLSRRSKNPDQLSFFEI